MGLMKKLTSAVVASSLVLGVAGAASAAYDNTGREAAAKTMEALKIINGRPNEGLALDATITRAELVTIIVRAFGQSSNAALLKNAPSFPDAQGHWASGEIALAKALIEQNGLSLGLPNGTFNPNGNITSADALGLMMKFLGVKEDTTKSYPDSFISGAVNAGLITSDDATILSTVKSTPASRGLVFYFANQAFGSYKLANGKTVYTTYVDTVAPELTVDNKAVDTTTAAKVTVTGAVKDASSVWVNGKAATITDGKFSADVELTLGKDNEITVTAKDLAGNATTKTITVSRKAGDVASIEAKDLTVVAGESVDLGAVAKDKDGNVVANAALSVDSTLGTYADGKFTASKTAGTGTATIKFGENVSKSISVTVKAGALDHVDVSAASVAPGTKVTLTAKDANGNAIANGVTYTQTSADALVDSTNGVFIASKAGTYTVTAKAGDMVKEVKIGVYDNVNGVAKYQVTTGASSVIANNASTIDVTVSALDANGNVIANNGDSVTLTSSSFAIVNSDGTETSLAAGSAVTLANGVKTVKVRTLSSEFGGKVATITAGTVGDAKATTANVTLNDQVATSLSVTAADTFLPTNTNNKQTTFTVKVLDQASKPMVRGYFVIDTTLSGTGVDIVGGDTATTKRIYVSSASGTTVTVENNYVGASGTVTLAAASTGLNGANASVTAQVAGPAAKVALTANSANAATPVANGVSTLTYDMKVTDAAGVPITNDTRNLTLTFPDLTSSNWGEISVNGTALTGNTATVTVTNGVGSFTVNARKYTGALNFYVKDGASSGALAQTANQTATFKADVPAAIAFTVNGASKSTFDVGTNAENTVVAQLYDAAGNKTTNASGKIELKATASAGGLSSDVVINGKTNDEKVAVDANGAATFTVKFGNFVSGQYTLVATGTYVDSNNATQTISASNIVVGGSTVSLGTASATATVKNSVPGAVSVALFANSTHNVGLSTANAGDTAYVRAAIVDGSGRKLSGQSLKVSTLNSDGTYTALATQPAFTDNNDGTYDFAVTPTTAPNVTYKVETTNAASNVSTTFSVGVRPLSTLANLTISGGDQNLTKNTVTAFTVNLADAYKNAIPNNTGSSVSVSLSLSGIPTNQLAQIKTAVDGLVVSSQTGGTASATVSVPAGAQSVTFYVVTNSDVNTALTLQASATLGGTSKSASATLTVK